MLTLKRLQRFFVTAGLSIVAASSAYALPNFARREDIKCSICHTSIPRLNRYGYEYRNSAYRDPKQIGKEAKIKDFGEMNSIRFQDALVYSRNSSVGLGRADNNFNINAQNMQLWVHPLTGAWGEYFGSRGQLTYTEGQSVDIEHANVRMAYGDKDSHFNARVGITHPFEGYGAADLNGIGLTSPLFLTNAPSDPSLAAPIGNASGTTYFSLLGANKAEVELGYALEGLDVSVSVNNGNFINSSGNFTTTVAGPNNMKPAGDPNRKAKDFQVYGNYFLGTGDTAVTVLYYHGSLVIPEPNGPSPVGFWKDTFNRLAGFATIELPEDVLKGMYVYAGMGVGWDDHVDPRTGLETVSKFRSTGYFVEPYYHFNRDLGASARFDYFDPSRDAGNDVMTAGTVAVNGSLNNGAQAILEYQFLHQQGSPTTNNQTLQLAFAYAY